ncbi:MAG: YccF domain-containing protein [Firmicutes bacterium]|nr:YccF domain-containing protein [Bacillota bacterium]
MKLLGNFLWVILCGLILATLWFIFGLLWCITIIGIPVGVQCFKFANLCLWPFGRDVYFSGSPVSLLLNILWIVFGGLEICLVSLIIGAVLCITIVGIPFGLQCFKIAKLALLPFGAEISAA